MAEHTPGPWWVDGPGEGIEVHDTFGRTASVWGDVGEGDEAWANARLIAAAPELLAALKDAYIALDVAQGYCDSEDSRMYLTRCRRKIKPVIDKAEGRSEQCAPTEA